MSSFQTSLRGQRSKEKGKGIRTRDHALSHAQIPPSPSPFNACHVGYFRLLSASQTVKEMQITNHYLPNPNVCCDPLVPVILESK